MRWSLGGAGLREWHEPEPPRVEEVDPREPGPLAVGLEQLGGLPRLDAAAPQRGAQLDEPEVADEPALEPPQPLDADEADRPGPEPALALEAIGRGRCRQRTQPLEVEGAAEPDERRASPRAQPEPAELRGSEAREGRGSRRRVQERARKLRRRGADHVALDLAGAPRGDQLPGDRTQQRVRGRGEPQRPETA